MSSRHDRTTANQSIRRAGADGKGVWWIGLLVALVALGPSESWAQDHGSGLASEVMEVLTAEQAEAFVVGADPSSLVLANGETLAEFLERAAGADGDRPLRAWVARTGQVISYGDRDDGELQKGVKWPTPRFRDNLDGTVRDNLTGLIWLQAAHCLGTPRWDDALESANHLADGQCGLTDGSSVNDWRLPNVRELQSLIDYGESNPALPAGHPFSGVQSWYWSSTTDVDLGAGWAWVLNLLDGFLAPGDKEFGNFVWPVRGGH